VKRFRDGLVFKAHRLVYHSTLGLRVIKKKKKIRVWDLTTEECLGMMAGHALAVNPHPLNATT